MSSFIKTTISRLFAMRAMTTHGEHDALNVTTSLVLSVGTTDSHQSLRKTPPIAVLPRDPMPWVQESFNFPHKAVLSSPDEQRGTFFKMGIKWAEKCSELGLFRGYSRPSSAGGKLLSPAIEPCQSTPIAVSLNSCSGG